MRQAALFVAATAIALVGCQKKDPVIVEVDAAVFVNPFPSLADRPIPSAPVVTTDAGADAGKIFVGGTDFEDLFDAADEGGDPTLLKKKPGFTSYGNPRYKYVVMVPDALVAGATSFDGDSGKVWKLGRLAAMQVGALNTDDGDTALHACASGPNVVAHEESKTKCFATGKRDGMIFYERVVIAAGVEYTLDLEYREDLKKTMDPIVTDVNKSWSYPLLAP